jgi:hypothetical protein
MMPMPIPMKRMNDDDRLDEILMPMRRTNDVVVFE